MVSGSRCFLGPCVFVIGLYATMTTAGGEEPLRTWTSVRGSHQREARFVELDGAKVRLQQEDGKFLTVLIDKLSVADQEYLRSLSDLGGAGGNSMGTGTFDVPALLTINTPRDFFWQEARRMEEGDVRSVVFTCTNDDSDAALVLTVEKRAVTTEDGRASTVKAYFNATIDGLQAGGFTELRASQPPLQTPVPNPAKFLIVGKTPDGVDRVFAVSILFGENVYLFQSVAPTQSDAESLLKTSESLQEYTASTSAANRETLANAIRTMIAVVERGDAREILSLLFTPTEVSSFLAAPNVDEEIARFTQDKVPALLAMLKSLDVTNARFLDNKASFDLPEHPALFAKIDGQWRLRN